MQESIHPAIDAKEFGQMLGICSKLAGEHIKNHPHRINVGRGSIRPRYRIPYDDAVAIATGKQELPELPRMPKPDPPPEYPKPPRRRKNGERAANGCLYAARRK